MLQSLKPEDEHEPAFIGLEDSASSTIVHMGARPEPVPQVVQTPASSVSALLGEQHDILQAIKSIPWERQLQLDQGKQVADKRSAFFSVTCLCGDHCHYSEKMNLGGSEMDVKLQIASCKCVCRLIFLLSDSYLRLGRAYKEDGQFNLALRAVELAYLTRGFNLNLYFADREKLQEIKDLRDPKAVEFAWRMRRLTPPSKEAFFPKGVSLRIQAWILAGDAYLEAQRTFEDSHVVIPYQEGEELKMPQEVEEVVYRVVRTCMCFYVGSEMLAKNEFRLPRIVENKWEKNLLHAAECYSNALYYSPRHEGSELTKIAYRKWGFVCHECGRRLAELGRHAKDETDKYFILAIDAFYIVKDVTNFELSLCSRIEYHRKLAEFRETQLNPDQGRIKILEKRRVKYQKVLQLCSEGKDRLKCLDELKTGKDRQGQAKEYKEVDLEEAHTYSKLGILLMEKDKIYYDKQEKPVRKLGQISADLALQKAINLYRKLHCEPEVANSQYWLGRVLRDRMLFEPVMSEFLRLEEKLSSIWWEATKYYLDVGDIDKYLRIRMEHSDLYSALPTKGLDQALIQLLEAIPCKMVVFGHGSSSVSEEFVRKLQELLKNMCTAAKSQPNNASSSSPSRANNYEFMEQMYRCALNLKLQGAKDYFPLYRMWIDYATVKS
ncbi:hypothetical protein KC19_3G241800 [Ceratodon purpureus]|uniref:Uncharacterized protein n=1 Tax=Ceratodon purpureus TaxID=3225 RepID=A0A8T0IPD5_CERPU|nr:hypothetical protein KC19_3G241800 [Ceratodon purpureus]